MAMVSKAGAAPRRSCFRTRAPTTRLALLALLALPAGCDFPTGLPKWNTEWLVPVESTTLTAAQLLPATVSFAADRAAFTLSVSPVTLSASLGELCGATCSSFSGTVVPKPAFTTTLVDSLRLPAEAAGATLASGTLAVTIDNQLGFDPLRPGPSARGTLTVAVTSGSTNVGRLVLTGDSLALPSGAIVSRSILLSGAVSSRLAVSMTLASPAGDPVRIDAGQRFSLTATPQSLRLSDVTVTVNQKQASVEPFLLDLGGIDQSLVDRVQGGSLVLDIANPFGVTGNMTLRLTSSGMTPIQKTVPLAAGSSRAVVDLTPQELRSMLGREVSAAATGSVSASQPLKLTPSQAIQITARLTLVLGPKES